MKWKPTETNAEHRRREIRAMAMARAAVAIAWLWWWPPSWFDDHTFERPRAVTKWDNKCASS